MIIYQSRFLTRGEVWFDNEATSEPVDWIIFRQRSRPAAKGKWRPFYTRIIDLTQPADALMAQMDGFTAADIKKAAKKDQTSCRKIDAKDQIALCEFADFYDRFAALKHLGAADRPWLERTAQAGNLDIWAADTPTGERQAYHVFYREGERVRSFHAASFYAHASSKEAQRKIGRANRLLVWESMMHYQAAGLKIFDLGGWYNGTTDSSLLGINKFKEGFGGKVICEFMGQHLKTLKAWSAVTTAQIMDKLKDQKDRGESGSIEYQAAAA
jgi:hypothetical protein